MRVPSTRSRQDAIYALALLLVLFQLATILDAVSSLAVTIVGTVVFYVVLVLVLRETTPQHNRFRVRMASVRAIVAAVACALALFAIFLPVIRPFAAPSAFGHARIGRKISTVLLHPVVEELLFRAVLVTFIANLIKRAHTARIVQILATPAAILISGILFAALHFDKSSRLFWVKAASGCVYGILLVSTESFIPPAVCHACANLLYWLI